MERVDIRSGDAGAAKIGHFGFFRPEHRDTPCAMRRNGSRARA
jgi:hypothetical protein